VFLLYTSYVLGYVHWFFNEILLLVKNKNKREVLCNVSVLFVFLCVCVCVRVTHKYMHACEYMHIYISLCPHTIELHAPY
jgi:hypothetical protein